MSNRKSPESDTGSPEPEVVQKESSRRKYAKPQKVMSQPICRPTFALGKRIPNNAVEETSPPHSSPTKRSKESEDENVSPQEITTKWDNLGIKKVFSGKNNSAKKITFVCCALDYFIRTNCTLSLEQMKKELVVAMPPYIEQGCDDALDEIIKTVYIEYNRKTWVSEMCRQVDQTELDTFMRVIKEVPNWRSLWEESAKNMFGQLHVVDFHYLKESLESFYSSMEDLLGTILEKS